MCWQGGGGLRAAHPRAHLVQAVHCIRGSDAAQPCPRSRPRVCGGAAAGASSSQRAGRLLRRACSGGDGGRLLLGRWRNWHRLGCHVLCTNRSWHLAIGVEPAPGIREGEKRAMGWRRRRGLFGVAGQQRQAGGSLMPVEARPRAPALRGRADQRMPQEQCRLTCGLCRTASGSTPRGCRATAAPRRCSHQSGLRCCRAGQDRGGQGSQKSLAHTGRKHTWMVLPKIVPNPHINMLLPRLQAARRVPSASCLASERAATGAGPWSTGGLAQAALRVPNRPIVMAATGSSSAACRSIREEGNS